jgi:8-oxo-dGTP diphosphatase
MSRRFNVRVYGLLIEEGKVLVSDEYIKGMKVTKFPGGGLEFGEGTIDCLRREMREELALETEVLAHFYTTDFFVTSAFDPQSQVISIYYTLRAISPATFRVSRAAHDYETKEGAQSFRWIDLRALSEDDLTLIIDRKVASMLSNEYSNAAWL